MRHAAWSRKVRYEDYCKYCTVYSPLENAQHMYFIWYTTNEEGKGLDSSPQVLIFVLFEALIRLQKLQRGITSVFLLTSPEAQRRCPAPRRWNETALSQLICWGQGSPRPVKVCYKMFWYFWSDSFILHSSSWICKYRRVEKRETFKNSSKLGFKQTASASTISSCLLSLWVFRLIFCNPFCICNHRIFQIHWPRWDRTVWELQLCLHKDPMRPCWFFTLFLFI